MAGGSPGDLIGLTVMFPVECVNDRSQWTIVETYQHLHDRSGVLAWSPLAPRLGCQTLYQYCRGVLWWRYEMQEDR